MSITRYPFCLSLLALTFVLLNTNSVNAQTTPDAPGSDIQRGVQPTPPTPVPETLPPVEDLFPSPVIPSTPENIEVLPTQLQGTIKVKSFQVEDSTVFSQEQLAKVTEKFTGEEITFAQLLQAADAITKLYLDAGYITSGAYIPANQTFNKEGSVVTIKVVEGSLESIKVSGTKRLNPSYVRSRLAIATGKPLNQKKLLEALQLLQLDPLLKNISAELATGTSPGTSILEVKVTEAKTRSAQIKLDNNRAPSIGSFQRQIQLNEANLLGLGDGLSVAYANTDGSNSWNVSYTLPINPRNGTVRIDYNNSSTKVIEEPFDILEIEGSSEEYSITYRQPLILTPTTEFALGITASRRESDIGFLEAIAGVRLPYPSPGADEDGKTKVSAVRVFQDWTQRSDKQVIAARSQFSLGINAFDATVNNNAPDSEFISWRGQAQWVRLLAPETLLLVRGDIQIADRALLPSEQIGIGGQSTVRGYRQDFLLADNGFLASAELRYPVLRVPQINGLLSLTPFVDFGTAWNNSQAGRTPLNNDTIASTGLGLLWQQSDRFTARLDWGIPLISVDSSKNSWQENGLYFSILYTQPF
ncbi:ShlB/FhaC/HecB family hemolysin secretion/activation protein [Halotia branconii]|uniref:ShlB/FhaC/HecB family hemolysin secretion/activation protein n=1 Tax=Halotia branconii CENA392 TaxID=1539056 RepID=A0AAJ6NPC6_9CYAN|nr:ShlB/FhaC/HecB family hemolysin secretion/activation protein [Halotia branconii]WGV24220.1 ShlB/FhaC/HecB family hemolysin secretion/activation protein [Halotia branconii CENA392]